ncbi:MAG: MFS transporter, partial [Bacteroidaceae bacterium]|nr:MFS transporter [Bacteroidaceae bacterium]
MFEGQPKGLWALALANTGERFGYYTMLAVFTLFLQANFGFDEKLTSTIFSTFLGLVYFLPLVGGILADKFGYHKMVTIGIFIMFAGYVLLSLPLGKDSVALIAMAAALVSISLGTGLFKGNLQVMVGELYNDPKYAQKRDSGFQLFYMAINIGAMFAPTAAIKLMNWAQTSMGASEADSYHYAFAVACASLIFSIAIYYAGMFTFRHVIGTKKNTDKKGEN